MTNPVQVEKARQFHALHRAGKMLVLPNVWDSLGALLLQNLQYPAIATASAAVAFANGVNDGEKMRFTSLLDILKTIAGHVTIPVSADIEGGYAANDEDLDKNIRLLIGTGIIGINIEDTDTATNTMRAVDEQCRRIRQIRKTADATGIPLFINARTDVFIHAKNFETDELRYQEALRRGLAYKEAGADCFYPIVMRDITHIQRLLKAVDMPVNLLTIAGLPDLHILNEMGVARVSLGPSFLKIAVQAMKGLALKLKDFDGLKEIVSNEITTDYLEGLVTGKR